MRLILTLCLTLLCAMPVHAKSGAQDVSVTATEAVNALRARQGLTALRVDPRLARAAAAHAQDMDRKRFFSHTGSDGSTSGNRARRQAYGPCVITENIAKGQPNLNWVLKSWMGSRGHRRNILHPEVTDFALVRGRDNIWVMMLGRPGC